MRTQKQQRLYVALATMIIALLLLAQFMLLFTYKTAFEEFMSISAQLESGTRTQEDRKQLVDEYTTFESAASAPGRQNTIFPTSALEFYTVVDTVMTANYVEHTSRSTTTGELELGSELRLQITFNGPYYNILKVLAAFRNSSIVMRVAEFNITGQSDGQASGSMIVVSRVQS
ncbi:MAG: hypothetical protein LBT31_08420 [Synergistaceae bacterium]|jgi:hypothetical protein|nr:hypothetical protein [Synergistaceae bacterium]